MMTILTLQQRSRELGRIRIGQKVATASGKTRPEKLDRFRLTSASQSLIARVAELYGGEALEWDNGGSKQYEVFTNSTRLPVLVPPQPVSQYFESWSAGGCQRRCDGVTELLKDRPCLCDPDPAQRQCKPTTRLNVVLRDVEGIGVWRLESHGWYSATELPGVADFLARAGGYVSAWLSLEQRTVIREIDGKPKTFRWMVPILEVDITPAQLLSGEGRAHDQLSASPSALNSGTMVSSMDDSAPPKDWTTWITKVQAARTVNDLRELWRHRPAEIPPPDAEHAFTERGAYLRNLEEGDGPSVPDPEPLGSADALWQQILLAAPEEWTTQQIETHFWEVTGKSAEKATAADMQRYLDNATTESTKE